MLKIPRGVPTESFLMAIGAYSAQKYPYAFGNRQLFICALTFLPPRPLDLRKSRS